MAVKEPENALSDEDISSLTDYIPLGCLVGKSESIDLTSEQWRLLSPMEQDCGLPYRLTGGLNALLLAGWIKITARQSKLNHQLMVFRIYVVPTNHFTEHVFQYHNPKLSPKLEALIQTVDTSPYTWTGQVRTTVKQQNFDTSATAEDGSLFYIFNTLPSPCPDLRAMKDRYVREALEDVLESGSALPGLCSTLYRYQQRSVGVMLQREASPCPQLDPRLEERQAPDGSTFFFAPRKMALLLQPHNVQSCSGGILAESMGLGKTVMVLALIVATRHHPPRPPPPYNPPSSRSSVRSLSQMAASSIIRNAVPWKVEFARLKHASGQEPTSCIAKLECEESAMYLKQDKGRPSRRMSLLPPKRMMLASTTILVVPSNLLKQWKSEIKKHVEPGTLQVLVMDDMKAPLPDPATLCTYDVILFDHARWLKEHRDGLDTLGRRQNQRLCQCAYIGASRIRDCQCVKPDSLYDSPLKYVHFKRLIVDEGHSFKNVNSKATTVAASLVTADHRWIISGTPAKNLFGEEMAANTSSALSARRDFSEEDLHGAVRSLRNLAKFLNAQPWVGPRETRADWDECTYRHEGPNKTYSSFSTGFRRTLEALVVKTRREDIEKDLLLPPLNQKVVQLEPSFYDKLTANLFVLVLTANAVTSERRDVDYLFHKNSVKARHQLVSNLRQSAFFWTGFSEADIASTIETGEKYLAKEEKDCLIEDRMLLVKMLDFAKQVSASQGWRMLSSTHELGLVVRDWPENYIEQWSFEHSGALLLTGVSQVIAAQQHVNQQTKMEDPGTELGGAGIRSILASRNQAAQTTTDPKGKSSKKTDITTSGVSASSLSGEPSLKRRSSTKAADGAINQNNEPASPKRQKHDMGRHCDLPDLPSQSPYLQSRIVGSTSAKLSYLMSQILEHYQSEKILVFYDGDNVAYYIAQALEVFHINHEIYAKSLKAEQKSEYVVHFNEDDDTRVLLMDVMQAAHGLNIPSASRIYFVNPVCRPNIEAQAIKRAHRIGQTRPVHVETLILKDTLESKMWERSRRMTHAEHSEAKELDDDDAIGEIIRNVQQLHISEEEWKLAAQVAPLQQPQQLWGREGWRESIRSSQQQSSRKRRKKIAAVGDGENGKTETSTLHGEQ